MCIHFHHSYIQGALCISTVYLGSYDTSKRAQPCGIHTLCSIAFVACLTLYVQTLGLLVKITSHVWLTVD